MDKISPLETIRVQEGLRVCDYFVTDDTFHEYYNVKVSFVLLFQLSKTFDMINHNILYYIGLEVKFCFAHEVIYD